ncbi:MAG: GtrA family protein, partial [Paludibacteraceae bacterium]|nr:GtrA family protein [Paludibacteraceae bacterium]
LGILNSFAFTAVFIIEMICNYFITSFYTFKMRPSWKNAGGFLFGRAINYVLQLMLLNLLIWLHLSEEYSGILAIMLAGVINYFVLLPFYKDKKREK